MQHECAAQSIAPARACPHCPLACSTARALTLPLAGMLFLELNSYVLPTCFRVLSPMARSAAALSKMRCLRSVYGTSCWENLRSSGLQPCGLSSCPMRVRGATLRLICCFLQISTVQICGG